MNKMAILLINSEALFTCTRSSQPQFQHRLGRWPLTLDLLADNGSRKGRAMATVRAPMDYQNIKIKQNHEVGRGTCWR